MEPSRSSSRLRENVKKKFKNTSNTPLTVDDDDDFVSPPPGVNIPGNKQGVLDAGQKPKCKLVHSGSEAYDKLDLWEKIIKLHEFAKSKKKKKPRRMLDS
ncbi:hypothetical protein L1887_18047 [Cichorium endivia]|nr:hypothetical protein L1887_18047 [Cichorium endivia]